MTLPLEAYPDVPTGGFDVRTLRCDATRASLHLSGDLGTDCAPVLAEVIDGHLRAGRRFLRINVSRVRTLSAATITVIAAAHERLLAGRGTLILTGVGGPLETVLRAAVPASPLFVLSPTADERDLTT